MKRPFVFIIIPLLMGIIFSYYLNINGLFFFPITLALIIAFIINILKEKSNLVVLFFLIFTMGALLSSYSLNNSVLLKWVNKDIIVSATIEEVLEQNENQGKYVIMVKSIEDKSLNIDVNEKSVLKIIGANNFKIGDNVTFQGRFNIPHKNTNPRLFNYRLNLLSNKIYTTSTIRNYSIIDIDTGSISFKYKIKSDFVSRIESIFDYSLSDRNSSLMKSIILGEYTYLDDENIDKYRDLGLAHILAVSGLHIGIIAGFIIYILANLGVKRKYNILITLGIIWLYGFLIGFPPSMLRANIMFSILYYAQLKAEPYDNINTLSFAGLILLIINPFWIFNLGFLLSFLATFSIIYLTPKIRKVFYPYRNKLTSSLSALLGVQIGLLPIQAYYFNKISLLSILANLLIAPILSFSLILGGMMVGLSYVLPRLNFVMGKALNLILDFHFNLLETLYSIPWGIFKLRSPNLTEIILYYLIVLMVVGVIRLKKFNKEIKKLIFYYLIVVLLFNFVMIMKDESLEIHFIDVGQGDSILIKTNKYNYLIDTGGSITDSFDVGKAITLPYLEKLGVNSLRGVFITHFDDDHSKSLPLLMDNIDIHNVLVSYEANGNDIYDSIKENNIPIKVLTEGDKITLDKNIFIQVINPSANTGTSMTKSNNLSLVFLLSYYNRSVLFTGDMEREVEMEIIERFNEPIDIIKVPHHGSSTSSTEELLYKLKPDYGIISVGRNNFYGHPTFEVVERYNNLGTKLYRTDNDGMIKVTMNKEYLRIDSYVKENSNIINLLDENSMVIIYYVLYFLLVYILAKTYANLKQELIYYEL